MSHLESVAQGASAISKGSFAPTRVLVIDDEALVATLLRRLLEAEGYETVAAASGEEALEQARRHHFDLAITDLLMPGMDGLQTMAALKSLDPDLEVIVLTGHAAVESSVAALKQGACDYLLKPLDLGALRAALRRALEIRRLNATVSMYEARRGLLSTLNPGELTPAILELSQRSLGAQAVGLALLSGDGGRWQVHNADTGTPIAAETVATLAEQVLRAREALRDPVAEGPGPPLPAGSVLAYPLEAHTTLLGALLLWRSPDAVPFTFFELQRGKALAAEIAVALDHARLYGELERKVDELEAAQAEVARADANARAIVEVAQEGIVLSDPNGVIQGYNPAAAAMFGWGREEAVGVNLVDSAVPPRLRDTFRKYFAAAERGNEAKRLETCALRQNGEEFPVEISITAIQTSRRRVISIFAHDITDRKRADEALRESESRFRRLTEANIIGIFVALADGRIVEANKAFLDLLAYTEEDLRAGLIRWDRMTPAEYRPVNETIERQILASGVSAPVEVEYFAKDGGRKPIMLGLVALDASGKHALGFVLDLTERKRREEQTRLQTAALEATANAVIIANREGRIIWVNPAFTRLTGYAASDAIGRTGALLKSGQQDAGFYRELWRTILSGKDWRGELVNRRKNGEVYIDEMLITPVLNGAGAITHFVAIKQDITARRQAEDHLRRSEAYLRAGEKLSKSGSWAWDLSTGELFWSQGVFDIFGFDPATTKPSLGGTFLERIHPEDRARIELGLRKATAQTGTYAVEYRVLLPDGTLKYLRVVVYPVTNQGGNVVERYGVVMDITDQKRAEQELKASEEQFREIAEHIREVFFTATPDPARLTYLSPGYEVIWGRPRQDVYDRADAWLDCVHPEDREQAISIFGLAARGERACAEYRVVRSDGSIRHVQARAFPVLGPEGKCARLVGIAEDITDRKSAEAALKESEQHYRLLFGQMIVGFALLEPVYNERGAPIDYRHLEVNSAFDKHTGLPRDRVLGRTIREVLPDIEPFWIEAYGKVATTGESVEFEGYARPLEKWFEVKAFLLTPGRVAVTFADITERKNTEESLVRYTRELEAAQSAQERHAGELARLVEELAHERDLLGILMDNVPDAIYFKDDQSRFTRINAAQARTLGLKDPQQAVGKTDFDFFPHEDAELYFADERRIMATGQPLIGNIEQVQDPGGNIHWVSNTEVPVKDAQGRVTGIVGVARNVTAWKSATEALRQSEERYRELFENASDIVYTTDPAGRFTSLNRVGRLLLGYSREEVSQLDLWHIVDPKYQEEVKRGRERLRAGEADVSQEVEVLAKDGRRVRLEVHPRPILQDGKMVGVQGIARDITGREAAELELRHAQKLESVGRLASGIAHEINTPIQFVGDNTRFLKDSFSSLETLLGKYRELRDAAASGRVNADLLDAVRRSEEESDCAFLLEEIPKALSQSLEGVTRVATIVRAMKEFAHPESKEMAAADLNRALLSTLTVARNELKYVADVETDFGELPPVICNVGDMNQVFLNLLVNAAHAIEDVVKGTGSKGKIRVRTQSEGTMALITIADTGGGIPEGIRNQIFDPFFTTKEVGRGTGQGLAIARSVVVDRHKGSLTFDSEVGKGTTFYVRLPFQPPQHSKDTTTP